MSSPCFLEVIRLGYRHKHPTFGVLLINSFPAFVTLELPDLANAVGISCIPVGGYKCQRITSPKHGETIHVLDVPGRSEIILHSGNSQEDTRGCILVGMSYSGKKIMDSRIAMRKLMARIRKHDEFWLQVRAI